MNNLYLSSSQFDLDALKARVSGVDVRYQRRRHPSSGPQLTPRLQHMTALLGPRNLLPHSPWTIHHSHHTHYATAALGKSLLSGALLKSLIPRCLPLRWTPCILSSIGSNCEHRTGLYSPGTCASPRPQSTTSPSPPTSPSFHPSLPVCPQSKTHIIHSVIKQLSIHSCLCTVVDNSWLTFLSPVWYALISF